MSQDILCHRDGLTFLTLPHWEQMGARAVFTSRQGGSSKGVYSGFNLALHVGDDPIIVLSNRQKACQLMDAELSHLVCCQQVHDDRVVVVDETNRGRGSIDYEDSLPETDGLITSIPGLVLTTFYADCIPVYFFDPLRKVVALSHSGWKGTMAGIAVKTMQIMQKRFGSQPQNIMVYIGPGIDKCCFEIQSDLADKVADSFLNDRDIIRMEQERIFWDLKDTIRRSLIYQGVKGRHITVSDRCTSCCTDYFYSFRKERGNTGRMAAMITLTDGVDYE